jgi:hypothetical protein
MWVAGGSGTNALAYSYNGINWTGLGKTTFSIGYTVAWNGSMWVAGGEGSVNTLAYSYNGIVWTGLGSTIFSTNGYEITWDGYTWFAAGYGTVHTLAYSYNGINWTGLGKTIFSSSGNAIAWNGKRSQSITLDKYGTTNTLQVSTGSYANANVAVNVTGRPF